MRVGRRRRQRWWWLRWLWWLRFRQSSHAHAHFGKCGLVFDAIVHLRRAHEAVALCVAEAEALPLCVVEKLWHSVWQKQKLRAHEALRAPWCGQVPQLLTQLQPQLQPWLLHATQSGARAGVHDAIRASRVRPENTSGKHSEAVARSRWN